MNLSVTLLFKWFISASNEPSAVLAYPFDSTRHTNGAIIKSLVVYSMQQDQKRRGGRGNHGHLSVY